MMNKTKQHIVPQMQFSNTICYYYYLLYCLNFFFCIFYYISTVSPRAFKCKEIACPHSNGEIDPTKCVGQYNFGKCCPEKYLCGKSSHFKEDFF